MSPYGLRFALAERQSELDAIDAFWRCQFAGDRALPWRPVLEQRINRSSYLFGAWDGDQIVAACRLTLPRGGFWEIGADLPNDRAIPFDPSTYLQLNRVAVASGIRAQGVHERLLLAFADWVDRHTEFRRFFSVCNPALVKLYRRYGIERTDHPSFRIPARAGRRYCFIAGSVQRSKRLLMHLAANPRSARSDQYEEHYNAQD